jgi:hypothetical protein
LHHIQRSRVPLGLALLGVLAVLLWQPYPLHSSRLAAAGVHRRVPCQSMHRSVRW